MSEPVEAKCINNTEGQQENSTAPTTMIPPNPPNTSTRTTASTNSSTTTTTTATTTTTTTNTTIQPRMASIYAHYQQSLQKIDALERRLEEKVAEKRHRAVNLLDEMPTCRTSTLRLYVTHTCHTETVQVPISSPTTPAATTAASTSASASGTGDAPESNTNTNANEPPKTKEVKRNKWKVCIEGRLLVGHKDHAAASIVDATAKQHALQDTGRSYVTHSDVVVNVEKMTSRERAATRFLHDREGEGIAIPIRFGHFFDRVSVSFQMFQKKKEVVVVHSGSMHSSMKNAAGGVGGVGGGNGIGNHDSSAVIPNKRRKSAGGRKSFGGASSAVLNNPPPPKKNDYMSNGVRSTLFWNRQRAVNNNNNAGTSTSAGTGAGTGTGTVTSGQNSNSSTLTSALDTNAFHAFYNEQAEPAGYENKIIATIKLHRHWRGERRYKPSDVFCQALLPKHFWPKNNNNKKDTSKNNHTSTSSSSTSSGTEHATTSHNNPNDGVQRPPPPPPTSNDIDIPTLFTMDECIYFLKMYITKHNLADDEQDLTMIRNNHALEQVFGCKTMKFEEMKEKLLNRVMLIPSMMGTKGDAPIVLTYVMTKDTATNFKDMDMDMNLEKAKEDNGGSMNTSTNANANASGEEKTASAGTGTGTGGGSKRKRRSTTPSPVPPPPPPEEEPITNLLSCDIDVDVPHLYHSRTRDILRRIKIREYEYTSCRTKALRTVEFTGASENVIKERMEDVVKNRALTSNGHLHVLHALAKAAPKKSEARMAAHVDARLTLLLDRLVEHGNKAKACWDIIDACEGYGYGYGNRNDNGNGNGSAKHGNVNGHSATSSGGSEDIDIVKGDNEMILS